MTDWNGIYERPLGPMPDGVPYDMLRLKYNALIHQVDRLADTIVELGIRGNEDISAIDIAIVRLVEAYGD